MAKHLSSGSLKIRCGLEPVSKREPTTLMAYDLNTVPRKLIFFPLASLIKYQFVPPYICPSKVIQFNKSEMK